jgi:glycosyltransferase involved in cell wall biosynthesis
MKLLVFAHTPPPHHGQSYMVQLMLDGFGGDRRKRKRGNAGASERQDAAVAEYRSVEASEKGQERRDDSTGIEVYHVNARLSKKLEDIGDLRIGKFILLLGYCIQAVWCRFRYGIQNFYYIPAPGKPSALYRDWMVMFICRLCYKRVVLHWHAAGLAKWLEMVVQMRTRSMTYRLMKRVDLSIVLSEYNRADAEKIYSKQIKIVSNGIPDPCPDFEQNMLPRRRARFAVRKRLLSGGTPTPEELQHAGETPNVVKVLYLAHCTREKGLFDAMRGVALASQRLAERRFAVSLRLFVTGTFVTAQDRQEFDRLAAREDMKDIVQYFGFVSGEQKSKLLAEADLFCFPTYYENENQPVNLIEAMAFGLPILTTRWRSLPELFPADYPGLVDVRSPEQIANVMPALMTGEAGDGFRDIFLRQYTLRHHLRALADALKMLEAPAPANLPADMAKASRQAG